jgi:hypothetical protein
VNLQSPLEDTSAIYLMGRPENLVPRLQARIDEGVDDTRSA